MGAKCQKTQRKGEPRKDLDNGGAIRLRHNDLFKGLRGRHYSGEETKHKACG